ncbi:MAG TPA: aldehyde dehydrogenase family protein [Miltoncostaeaceae bacterium]|nr:aldehyde dehydrogenase family protein [Miltoncostaeaceae bacterium]
MASPAPSELAVRAAAAQPAVAALSLDERLARAARARAALADVGAAVVDRAVAELGQPRRFARRELESALGLLDALPGLAEAIRPRPVPAVSGSTRLEWAPYGVVLGWHAANSPVWVPTVVSASALVAGNAVLARPSARARRTGAVVLEALGAAWPADAIVRVDLPGPEAEPLVWDPNVHAVVAHASTATCKRQLAALGKAYAAGARLRPYIAEGSGNDAMIVLAGADLEQAAQAAAIGGFANGGQLCMAAKRIIVERRAWEGFRPRLTAAVAALRVGAADDEATDIGPLPEGRARAAARAALTEALACGGEVVVGGGEAGAHVTPTVVLLPRTALDAALWREESFAPVRGLALAEDPADALALANDSAYGLGAAVFGPGEEVVAGLRAARVLVDEGPLYQDPHLVVGGVGDSGTAGARPKLEQLVFARRVHRAAGSGS